MRRRKKYEKALIPIIAIVMVIIAVFTGSYNSLVSKQTDVENGAKSDKVFTSLMDELSGTENRIAYARG